MTMEILKDMRSSFEKWISHRRKNEWKWEHADLEREADPDPKEFKGKLGHYTSKETQFLWDLWQVDANKLTYIYDKMDHKFNYGPDFEKWKEYNDQSGH